jgi:hypothetical protein
MAVTIKGKKFASYREALLTGCADDPKLFEIMDNTVNQATDLISGAAKMGNSEDAWKEYEKFKDLRQQMTEYMHDPGGFEKEFFANGVLNSAVFGYNPLDAYGWKLLADARSEKNIVGSNVCVVRRQMNNGTDVTEVAHSGLVKPGKQSMPGTIKRADKDNPHFHQFVAGIHRMQDSESKFFEYLLEQINKGELDPSAIKRLVLYTERPVCPSCLNVIREFKNKFNIEIIVYEGKHIN